jgi:hypothetical protein
MVLLSNTPLDWNGLSNDRWKILYTKPGQHPANKDAYENFTLSEYLSYVSEKKNRQIKCFKKNLKTLNLV